MNIKKWQAIKQYLIQLQIISAHRYVLQFLQYDIARICIFLFSMNEMLRNV